MNAERAIYLDSSALVKLAVAEKDPSENTPRKRLAIRAYEQGQTA